MRTERIRLLVNGNVNSDGKYVLYWMQQSQRINYNHALAFAIDRANVNRLPLVVYFGLAYDYPEANERHYAFMLEGLNELKWKFNQRGIGFVIKLGNPDEGIKSLLTDAKEVIMDMGYMRIQRIWRENVEQFVRQMPKRLFMVESDLVVPVQIASNKMEYSARTIRMKLIRVYEDYLDQASINDMFIRYNDKLLNETEVDISNIQILLDSLNIDHTVKRISYLKGGEGEAQKHLQYFLENRFKHYKDSNSPAENYCSELSPYLHFGQISSVNIVKQVLNYYDKNSEDISDDNLHNFIEQLVVRRELAFNYVFYNEGYDKFDEMTDTWAYKTMTEHQSDARIVRYSLEKLENCLTHDVYWNTAMLEMKKTGIMHNYMRMYWAKKIIEWTADYKKAYESIIYLNNKYFLDGRDANSYTGVAWCFGKHDRAWTERVIFGKLRYMNDKGLERKFDMKKYIQRIEIIKD